MALFMIKYGKEEHLKQIVDGSLRFAPSQTYVKMEELLHNKGQGDLLDGKMKIRFESAKMYDPDTNELKGEIPNCVATISIQDVNDMPIFCISHYGVDDTECYKNIRSYKISLRQDNLNCIKQDFSEATHALIILEPDKFIAGVQAIKGHQIIHDQIRYYNYDSDSLQMYMYLATGNTEEKFNERLTLTYENRYRHLLCKDIDFEKQQEYRFIVLDDLITKPVFYDYEFSSEYVLVPIDDLKHEITIELPSSSQI
jgi:hypothetical protein